MPLHRMSNGVASVPQWAGLDNLKYGYDQNPFAWQPWMFGLERKCYEQLETNGQVVWRRYKYRVADAAA